MATLAATATAGSEFMGYAARARWSTVRIEAEGAVYVGRICVPEMKTCLSAALSDERPFIVLTEVSVNDSEGVEGFVAINKSHVKSVRVLDEGDADVVVPIRGR